MSVALVGVGQLGGVFARGLLRRGHEVLPVLRHTPGELANERMRRAEFVVVTVGEADLGSAIGRMPAEARGRAVLVQNELLPVDWTSLGVADATVAVVWFEKKYGEPVHPICSTPVSGPHADEIVACIASLGIPANAIPADELARELVLKNLYILVSNLGGLATDSATVGELAEHHPRALEEIAWDVLRLERARLGQDGTLPDDQQLFTLLLRAIEDDPAHGARGRSAPSRLTRALERADALGVDVPALRAIDPG